MITVLLVDDHDLVRTGIRRLLEDANDIDVVAEARNGEQAVSLAREHQPNVILMDVNMPGMGGLEATRKLLRINPEFKILVVTMHDDGPLPASMLETGAIGYLTKGCDVEEMIRAIRLAVRGQRYISAAVAQQMVVNKLEGGSTSIESLSPRELQVMLMVSQGHKLQEISEQMCLSPKTVSTYRTRLMRKLGASTDVELTHLALRHGLIGTQNSSA